MMLTSQTTGFFMIRKLREIRNCASDPQEVTFTFVGGEIMRLGRNRILDIWHLPGHSHGHLGVYDRNHRALNYGDAIQRAGYTGRSTEVGRCAQPIFTWMHTCRQSAKSRTLTPR
jgi:glyoxylase-like metal-dependent hydrolase (beta-lactamase superfamily II)